VSEIKEEKDSGVGCVIPAAGSSSRMGSLKQLLPVEGVPLVARVTLHALSSELEHVVVVLGCCSEKIRVELTKYCSDPKLSIIENGRWEEGLSSSIIAGLSIVEKRFDHTMIILGDMPNVSPGLINLLIHRYLDSGASIGAVEGRDRRYHPVVFGRDMYFHLHALQGDVGGRALFDTFPERVYLMRPDKRYDFRDIDTPEDYSRLS
jgi:molybdenum cofactor cytidylyltransferase